MFVRRAFRVGWVKLLWSVCICGALAGCAPLEYAPMGKVLTGYAHDEFVPYVETSDDPSLSCGSALGLDQLLGSFQRVIKRPYYDLMYAEMSAATCSERKSYAQDLRFLRAVRDHRGANAKDALIAEQHYEVITARRRYHAYLDMVALYGKPGKQCPRLTKDSDQFAYLMGILAGLQAIRDDVRSGGQVGVPRNIALKSEEASHCLSNRKWWGVPGAIRASVWTIVPGAVPTNADPWKQFLESDVLAEHSGVRLAIALYAMTAQNQGKTGLERQAIALFASTGKKMQAPKAYRLIDRLAEVEVHHLSDQIWTRKTGARTPQGAFGTFPDAEEKTHRFKSLLNGLSN